LDGYDFFHFYTAAHDVSGDCFDYVPIVDNRIAVVVADVCGKAIPAALLMANFASEVRAQLRAGQDATEAVRLVNAAICVRDAGRFITMILLVIDPSKHEIEIVNAGHWPPVLRRCDGSTVKLTSGKSYFPVGIFPDVQYESIKVPLEPGETILAFSDGIIDAQDANGEAYEYERLCRCFADLDGSALEIGRGLQRDIMRFSGDAEQVDDICLVCFGRNQ
jgi:serine phosphatase RsbU (regulator of sigma subunit)